MGEAAPDERVGVLAQDGPDHQRVHDERNHRHAAEEDGDETGVGVKGGEAGGGDGRGHEAEDAVGRDADDQRDDVVDDACGIVQHGFGDAVGVAQGGAGEDCPGEDADVVAVGGGADGVVGDFEEQGGQHFFQAFRRGDGFGVAGQVQGGGVPGAGKHGDGGCGKRADDVKHDDGFQPARLSLLVAGDGVGDEDEDEDGGDGAQRLGEEVAENLEVFGGLRQFGDEKDAADEDAEQHRQEDLADERFAEPAEELHGRSLWWLKGRLSYCRTCIFGNHLARI